MTDEEVNDYFLSLPETWLDYPFGDDVRVYKVKNKMFGTMGWEDLTKHFCFCWITLQINPR